MIHIIMDNNALGDIADNANYPAIVAKLNALYRDQQLILQFSPVSFYEQLLGVKNDRTLELAQGKVKRAYELTCTHFLCDPHTHVRNAVGLASQRDIEGEALEWMEIFRRFCNCQDYADFQNLKFENIKKGVKDEIRDIHNGDIDLANRYGNEIFQSQNSINRFRLLIIEASFKHFKCQFILNSAIDDKLTVIRNIESKTPCLTYFTFLRSQYYKMYKDTPPQLSDYFDVEQSVYLNICDYIVTKDKNFINACNECGCEDLKGRALKTEDFLESLGNFNLLKRAPQSSKSVRIGPV